MKILDVFDTSDKEISGKDKETNIFNFFLPNKKIKHIIIRMLRISYKDMLA